MSTRTDHSGRASARAQEVTGTTGKRREPMDETRRTGLSADHSKPRIQQEQALCGYAVAPLPRMEPRHHTAATLHAQKQVPLFFNHFSINEFSQTLTVESPLTCDEFKVCIVGSHECIDGNAHFARQVLAPWIASYTSSRVLLTMPDDFIPDGFAEAHVDAPKRS